MDFLTAELPNPVNLEAATAHVREEAFLRLSDEQLVGELV